MNTQVTPQLIKELVIDIMSNLYPGSFYEIDVSEDLSTIRLSVINYGNISGDWERYEIISRPYDYKSIAEAIIQITRLTLPIDAIPFQKQKAEHHILPLLKVWYNGDEQVTLV